MEGDGSSQQYKKVKEDISIHSLRMEGDATPAYIAAVCFGISIHSLRMEGDCNVSVSDLGGVISIHSLRMEGDVGQSTPIQGLRDFNPLPPHGGRPVS